MISSVRHSTPKSADSKGLRKKRGNPVIDPFEPERPKRSTPRSRKHRRAKPPLDADFRAQLKNIAKQYRKEHPGKIRQDVLVLPPSKFKPEPLTSADRTYDLTRHFVFPEAASFSSGNEIVFSTQPRGVQNLILENSRIVRQLWRSGTGVAIAVKFPSSGPPPTLEQLGVLGHKPGFGFGVVLPGIMAYGATRRVARLPEDVSLGEEVATYAAAGDAYAFLGFGVANWTANGAVRIADRAASAGRAAPWLIESLPWARAVKFTGNSIPWIGAGYNVASGTARYFNGESSGYISPTANAVLSATEIAAGPIGLRGMILFMRPLCPNPWVAAGLVLLSAVLSLSAPMMHEELSNEGVAYRLVDELWMHHHNSLPDHDSRHTARIRGELRRAHRFQLFDETTVLKLLELLGEEDFSSRIDWRNDIVVQDIRHACYAALVRVAKNRFGFFNDEEAAALLFFGMHGEDSGVQETVLDIFLEETKGAEEEAWRDFVDRYRLFRPQYRDLSHFYGRYATPYLKEKSGTSAIFNFFKGLNASLRRLF